MEQTPHPSRIFYALPYLQAIIGLVQNRIDLQEQDVYMDDYDNIVMDITVAEDVLADGSLDASMRQEYEKALYQVKNQLHAVAERLDPDFIEQPHLIEERLETNAQQITGLYERIGAKKPEFTNMYALGELLENPQEFLYDLTVFYGSLQKLSTQNN